MILFGEYFSQYTTVIDDRGDEIRRTQMPKPPPTVPSRNATTTTPPPYMTSFSFALSLFQNA